jgi:serine/threonine-protein kinase RsbW
MLLAQFDIEISCQKMVLGSNLRNIEAVEKLITNLREQYLFSDDLHNRIWIVLNEAVTNAIRHGNKFNPSKNVKLLVEQQSDRFISFTIKDQGEGFDPDNVPDPTSPERIEEPNGRGVFLIRKLADYVCYSANGTAVEVRFDLFSN